MTTYDLGDGVNLRHLVYDRDGVLTAATVSLVVTAPDGTTSTPTVSSSSTGVYVAATVVVDQAGSWLYVWSISGAVTDVDAGAFTVADPAPALYVPLTLVKGALGKSTADDRDDLVEQAIRSASRRIDEHCGRRFYADRTVSTRTYSAAGRFHTDGEDQVFVTDDIASADGLLVEYRSGTTWTEVDDVEPGPDNAAVWARPYTHVRALAGWVPATGRVRVTAVWGWPAVPDQVVEAAKLLAARLYRRKDSPHGVLGNSEWGVTRVSAVDPDVEALIAPFVLLCAD